MSRFIAVIVVAFVLTMLAMLSEVVKGSFIVIFISVLLIASVSTVAWKHSKQHLVWMIGACIVACAFCVWTTDLATTLVYVPRVVLSGFLASALAEGWDLLFQRSKSKSLS